MNFPELPRSNFDIELVGLDFDILPPKDQCEYYPERREDSHEVFECDVCSKILGSRDSLDYHKRIHNQKISPWRKEYECSICDIKFKSKSSFKDHKRAKHSNDNDLQCEFCLKKFASRRNLIRHRRIIHTGEKPYGCDFCEEKFRYKNAAENHMKNCPSK